MPYKNSYFSQWPDSFSSIIPFPLFSLCAFILHSLFAFILHCQVHFFIQSVEKNGRVPKTFVPPNKSNGSQEKKHLLFALQVFLKSELSQTATSVKIADSICQ
jgi:hypothetical protein